MCRDPFPGQRSKLSVTLVIWNEGHTSYDKFLPCPFRGIRGNYFICGIYTRHMGTMRCAPFSWWRVKGQGHKGRSKFLTFSLCSSAPNSPILFIWDTHSPWGRKGLRTLFRSKRQRSRPHGSFEVLSHSLRGFLFVWLYPFIYSINTTHDGTMCHVPFSGWKVKDQGHMRCSKFFPCPFRGFFLIWPNHLICGIHATHEGAMCRATFVVIRPIIKSCIKNKGLFCEVSKQ